MREKIWKGDERMLPKHRTPSHPGEVLLEEFLKPMKLTQLELAFRIKVSVQRINTLIKGKRDMTPHTAILLSQELETSPEFWMNLQTAYDLFIEQEKIASHAA